MLFRSTDDVYAVIGETIELQWLSQSVGGNATLRVFYDYDGVADSGDEVILTSTQEQASGQGRFVWDTTGIVLTDTNGDGVVDDRLVHVGVTMATTGAEPLTAYAQGMVLLASPTRTVNIMVTRPASPLVVSNGETVTITWADYDQIRNGTITVFYDRDTTPNSGNETILYTTVENPDGTAEIGRAHV